MKILTSESRSEFMSPQKYFTVYFHQRASRAQKQRASVVYIALDTQQNDKIVGYYTLSNIATNTESLRAVSDISLARYDVMPTTLLGMLSRCEPSPEPQFGRALLYQALYTSLALSQFCASTAVVLKPFDIKVAAWYRSMAFKDLFADHPGSMMFYEMRKLALLGLKPWPGLIYDLSSVSAMA